MKVVFRDTKSSREKAGGSGTEQGENNQHTFNSRVFGTPMPNNKEKLN